MRFWSLILGVLVVLVVSVLCSLRVAEANPTRPRCILNLRASVFSATPHQTLRPDDALAKQVDFNPKYNTIRIAGRKFKLLSNGPCTHHVGSLGVPILLNEKDFPARDVMVASTGEFTVIQIPVEEKGRKKQTLFFYRNATGKRLPCRLGIWDGPATYMFARKGRIPNMHHLVGIHLEGQISQRFLFLDPQRNFLSITEDNE